MIVSCRKCQSQFQLDESRIPLEGIRVRCSRCKEAFYLSPPKTDTGELVQGETGQTMADDISRPPDVGRDLDVGNLHESASPIGAQADPRDSDADEADWEFNLESPDLALPDVLESESHDLELDFGHVERDPGLAPGAEPEAGSEHSAFGSVDDFSEWLEDDPETSADLTLMPGSRTAQPPADSQRVVERNGDLQSSGRPRSGISNSGAQSSPAPAAELSTVTPKPADTQVVRPDTGPVGSLATGSLEYVRRRRAGRDTLSAMGRALGWAVTLGLLGIGLASGLRPSIEARMVSPQTVALGDFSAEALGGEWQITESGENILVVTGHLLNISEQPRELGGELVVSLRSAGGREIDSASAWAELAGLDVESGWGSARSPFRHQAAGQLAGQIISAGESVPIRAAFSGVQADVAHLDVTLEANSGEGSRDFGLVSAIPVRVGHSEAPRP